MRRMVFLVSFSLGFAWAAAAQVPEFFGTYAVSDNALVPVDRPTGDVTQASIPVARRAAVGNVLRGSPVASSSSQQVPSLSPATYFITYYQPSGLISAMTVAQDLTLTRLVFVRQLSVDTGWPENVRRRGAVNAWDEIRGAGGIDKVALRYKPHKNERDMVAAVPPAPLAPAVYVLTGSALDKPFVFVVSAEQAAAARCVDATCHFTAMMEECSARACSGREPAESIQVQAGAAADTDKTPKTGAGPTAVGFRIKADGTPVYVNATGPETSAVLPAGALAANAKGSLLGMPSKFELEESNGRTHVCFLKARENRGSLVATGWVDSGSVERFAYSCSCGKRPCQPYTVTMRGSTWNECFDGGSTPNR